MKGESYDRKNKVRKGRCHSSDGNLNILSVKIDDSNEIADINGMNKPIVFVGGEPKETYGPVVTR